MLNIDKKDSILSSTNLTKTLNISMHAILACAFLLILGMYTIQSYLHTNFYSLNAINTNFNIFLFFIFIAGIIGILITVEIYRCIQRIDKMLKVQPIELNDLWVEYHNKQILDDIFYDKMDKLLDIYYFEKDLLRLESNENFLRVLYAGHTNYLNDLHADIEFHIHFKERKQRDKKLAIKLFKEIKYQPNQEKYYFKSTIRILNREISLHAELAKNLHAILTYYLYEINDISKRIIEIKREKLLIKAKMELLEWM